MGEDLEILQSTEDDIQERIVKRIKVQDIQVEAIQLEDIQLEAQVKAIHPPILEQIVEAKEEEEIASSFLFTEHVPLYLPAEEEKHYGLFHTDPTGTQWRIMWYPKGNLNLENNDTSQARSSFYLEVNATEASYSIQFTLGVIHSKDPLRSYFQKADYHNFTESSSDWGYKRFYLYDDLKDEKCGFVNSANNTIELSVEIEYVPVPPDTPYWDRTFLDYDSKKETGMIGLKNQGATCYMNSLLQTLFHLPKFRQAVYCTPTVKESISEGVCLALQRVFYRLQSYEKAISTKELTKSFGWGHMDSFTQHDVQELYRILCDRVEEKMKSAKVENTVQEMFEGVVRSFIRCVNVEFTSARNESFYDIQLDVKGCPDILTSFRKYIEVEMLNGENQYAAEGHGKQDAEKGLSFVRLPPVLNLQLKRFEYDPLRDGMVKIHDRFEFPLELSLDAFVQPAEEGSEEAIVEQKYHLHSILVHSGDVHGGHYYVYLRPNLSVDEFFKFDDDRITKITTEAALEDGYGNQANSTLNSPDDSSMKTDMEDDDVLGPLPVDEIKNTFGKRGRPLMSFSSAYMLVYVRESEMENMMQSGTALDVPTPLMERFIEEEEENKRIQLANEREHLYTTIKVATDFSINAFNKVTKTADFVSWMNTEQVWRFKVQKSSSVAFLHCFFEKRLGIPIRLQRLWQCSKRDNNTMRPDNCLSSLEVTIHGLCDLKRLNLYLQILPSVPKQPTTLIYSAAGDTFVGEEEDELVDMADDESFLQIPAAEVQAELTSDLSPTDIILFIKFYDAEKVDVEDRIKYIGSVCLDKTTFTVQKLMEEIKIACSWLDRDRELACFDEVEPSTVPHLTPSSTLVQSELQNGDMVYFQYKDLVPEEALKNRCSMEVDPECKCISTFFLYLVRRCEVTFYNIDDRLQEHPLTLPMSRDTSYTNIMIALSKSLGIPDPLYLRLYKHNPITGLPRESGLPHTVMTQAVIGNKVADLVNFHPDSRSEKNITLHYERLDFPITELDSKRVLKISYLKSPGALSQNVVCMAEVEDTVGKILEQARDKLHLQGVLLSQLRLCRLRRDEPSLIREWFIESDLMEIVPKNQEACADLRYVLDIIEPCEVQAYAAYEEDPRLDLQSVSLFYFEKAADVVRPHGVPFMTYFTSQDTILDFRKRIQQKLNVDDDVFARWKLALMKISEGDEVESIEETAGDRDSEKVLDILETGTHMDTNWEAPIGGATWCFAFGLECPNPKKTKLHRRVEQGIVIRQNQP